MRVQRHPDVRRTGTGTFVPERVVSNKTLEGMVKGFDARRSGDFGEWVDQVTHIHERRFCEHETRSSDLALPAARQALAEAGIGARSSGLRGNLCGPDVLS